MQEYVTEAISLTKDALREQDGRYTFFTKHFGKLAGKATSSRKIISKLAPHLEPGTVLRLRLVETGGIQIVDALKIFKLKNLRFSDLYMLERLLPEVQPEMELWNLLLEDDFSWNRVLGILGWDPDGAICSLCGRYDVRHFSLRRQEFVCASCASKLPKFEVLLALYGVQSERDLGEQTKKV